MTSQVDIDAAVAQICSDISATYKDLNQKEFFNCLIVVMEAVEKMVSLTGVEKKAVVIGVLTQLVNSITFSNAFDKEAILFLIQSGFLSTMIDSIIKLTKIGCKINIPKIEKSCLSCCCCKKCKK